MAGKRQEGMNLEEALAHAMSGRKELAQVGQKILLLALNGTSEEVGAVTAVLEGPLKTKIRLSRDPRPVPRRKRK